MSANLDLVRSIYTKWERGDFFGDADWAHSDIDYTRATELDPEHAVGIAGMADSYGRWLAAWEDLRVDVDEYRELDDGRVLVTGRLRGRGRASGAEVERGFANLLQLREGRVARIVIYNDRDRALADVGLEE